MGRIPILFILKNLVNPVKRAVIAIGLLSVLVLPGSAQRDLTRYVNPFIGTGGHGHTFPGAIVPFGMVQPSPDTRLTGWDSCSGYHYSDSIIYGSYSGSGGNLHGYNGLSLI